MPGNAWTINAWAGKHHTKMEWNSVCRDTERMQFSIVIDQINMIGKLFYWKKEEKRKIFKFILFVLLAHETVAARFKTFETQIKTIDHISQKARWPYRHHHDTRRSTVMCLYLAQLFVDVVSLTFRCILGFRISFWCLFSFAHERALVLRSWIENAKFYFKHLAKKLRQWWLIYLVTSGS